MLYFDQEPRAGLPPSKSECPWPVDFVADTLQGEIIKQTLSAVQNAKDAADDAREKAEAASASVEQAKTAAQSAQTGAERQGRSGDSSKLSKSWAVGGTGVREGESLNNAMYWASVAEAASAGGVLTFNGRSGAVAPQKGDYTAAMVGADKQGAAQTVQDNLNTHAQNTTAHISATERTSWNAKANAADLTSHVDDAAVHVTATEKAEWNSKVGKSTKVNLTLYASSWSTEKKYTVSNANITATSAVELLPRENNGITQAQMEALSGAMIVGGTQAAGSIQLVALGDKPTTDIPVTLIIRRDL